MLSLINTLPVNEVLTWMLDPQMHACGGNEDLCSMKKSSQKCNSKGIAPRGNSLHHC
jgi:hypothetical protein